MRQSLFNDFLRRARFSRIRDLKQFIAVEQLALNDLHVRWEPRGNFYTVEDIGYKNVMVNGRMQRVKTKRIKDRGGLTWYDMEVSFL